MMQISQNQALYSLLNTVYGGDGATTFALPDLRGRLPVGTGQGTGLSSNVQFGKKRGQETVALTVASLPPHTHPAQSTPGQPGVSATPLAVTSNLAVSTAAPTTATPNLVSGQNAYLANAATTTSADNANALKGLYQTTAPAAPTATISVTSSLKGDTGVTGSGQPVSIVPPEIGMSVCIVTQGLYPMRP